jgi:hypothetical protein
MSPYVQLGRGAGSRFAVARPLRRSGERPPVFGAVLILAVLASGYLLGAQHTPPLAPSRGAGPLEQALR